MINTDGTGFTNLYTFSPLTSDTNSDGATPSDLFLSGSTLYGLTVFGGTGGVGTIFAISTDGKGFSALHSFTPASFPNPNYDGANPRGALVQSGDVLYGTAQFGGTAGRGTVFSLSAPPRVFLTGTAWLESAQFQFGFDTVQSENYTIQYSTTLTDWSSVLSFTSPGGPMTVRDPNVSKSSWRFYRIEIGR